MPRGIPDPSVPENALQILYDATDEISTSRSGHQVIQRSLDTLKIAIGQWRAMQERPAAQAGPPGPAAETPENLLTEDDKH